MSRKVSRTSHSVYEINYHLILVVKYRRKVINNSVSARLKEIFVLCGEKYHLIVKAWNHDRDHIHVMFQASPDSDLKKFISVYKSASSRLIKNEFPGIRRYLWKEYFWSGSFCLITTGRATIDVIERYIKHQGR